MLKAGIFDQGQKVISGKMIVMFLTICLLLDSVSFSAAGYAYLNDDSILFFSSALGTIAIIIFIMVFLTYPDKFVVLLLCPLLIADAIKDVIKSIGKGMKSLGSLLTSGSTSDGGTSINLWFGFLFLIFIGAAILIYFFMDPKRSFGDMSSLKFILICFFIIFFLIFLYKFLESRVSKDNDQQEQREKSEKQKKKQEHKNEKFAQEALKKIKFE